MRCFKRASIGWRLQQERLYAEDSYALLVIFQAMDAAGKDSTIKHVMRGVNPRVARYSASRRRHPRSAITTTCGGP